YHDLLFESQFSGFGDENLIGLAERAGFDTRQFERDYENARYEPLVRADFQKGLNAGVNGTPTFFINGEMLVGLQPIGVFERAIEDARREAEGG
ncbi:MAG TPA: DsbA family protein, partial [Rubrobacter sp.]|nr:DsbA family protein [Rubrobacter sp.]